MAYQTDIPRDGVAPWYNVPLESIMAVEHPCIVKNSAKGIDMLGGSRSISQTLEAGIDRTLPLSFHPQDPASRTVLSLHHRTQNVLLKVTVPKRTGRKRKRGTSDQFVEDPTQSSVQNAPYLIKGMKDNHGKYTVEPVGGITSSHMYRNMPEFVYNTKNSAFLKQIEQNILPLNYTQLKGFSLPRTYGVENTEAVPPPTFSTQTLPHYYMYRQNPAVQPIANPVTGEISMGNRTAALKTYTHQWPHDAEIPSVSMPECPPLADQPEQFQALVKHLEGLFEKRPIWTRRALHNNIPNTFSIFMARYAIAYVAFSAKSGPWRDAVIKLGVDPRLDPSLRKYQTIVLQLNVKGKKTKTTTHDVGRDYWSRSDDPDSHIFTGQKPIPKDGKIWQLCDLEDPQLKSLVEISELYIRPQCEIRYFGWYLTGTMAKLRIVLKAKVDALLEGNPLDPSTIQFLIDFPDRYDETTIQTSITTNSREGFAPKGSNLRALEWATAYRTVRQTPAGMLPSYGIMGKGRVSIPKPKSRPSYTGDINLANKEALEGDEELENLDEPIENGDEDNIGDTTAYAEPAEGEGDEDSDDQDEGVIQYNKDQGGQ